MTYSLTRFAIYETVRDRVAKGSEGPLPFYKKVLLGAVSGEWGAGARAPGPRGRRDTAGSRAGSGLLPGCIGGFVGTPADMVNVRSVAPKVRVSAVPRWVRPSLWGEPRDPRRPLSRVLVSGCRTT